MKKRNAQRGGVFLLMFVFCTTWLFAQATHPTARQEAVGFSPTHTLANGGLGEYIDHQSGQVTLAIPLGSTYQVGPRLSYQLLLAYGSHIWDVQSIGAEAFSKIVKDGPFGVGFSLHMGRIEAFQGQDNTEYEYVSADGARHRIGVNTEMSLAGLGTVETTLDGTNIKVERFDSSGTVCSYTACVYPSEWLLHFPDGTSARFDADGTSGYSLIELWSPEAVGPNPDTMLTDHAAWVTVTYGVDVPDVYESCILKIEDSLGREILFTNETLANGDCRTNDIEQRDYANGSTTIASWTFDYYPLTDLTPPGCNATGDGICGPPGSYDCDCDIENQRSLLKSVTLPGPALEEPVLEFDYLEPDLDFGVVTDGILRQRFLPRQASEGRNALGDAYYEYEYGPTTFKVQIWVSNSPGPPLPSFEDHEGRALIKKTQWFMGSQDYWTWTRAYDSWGNATQSDCTDPDVNLTTYEYEDYDLLNQNNDWRAGLPIEIKRYAGSTLLRSETIEYAIGFFQSGAGGLSPRLVQNIREIERHTYLEGEVYSLEVVERRLGFDPYGRPSDVIIESPGQGLYRRAETSWISPTSTWVLGSWSRKTTYNELGQPFSVQDASFSDTGLLLDLWRRTDASGTVSTDDVHTNFIHDLDSDPSGYGWGLVAESLLSGADGGDPYKARYDYQANTYLARVLQLDSQAIPTPERNPVLAPAWFSRNQDVDPNTGLVIRALNANDEDPSTAPTPPSGHPTADDSTFAYDTAYDWDTLGRLTEIRPPGESPTSISYVDLWRTEVQQCRAADPTDCRVAIYKYDRLGRLVEERQSDKDGNYNGRRTAYDWAGRVLRRSEWFSCDEAVTQDCDPSPATLDETVFDYTRPTGNVDPLGRPWKITASDAPSQSEPDKTSVVTFTHNFQVRTATAWVGDSAMGAYATTRWTYDAFGRLVAVNAPEGADAVYAYDVRDQLIRAELYDEAGQTTQVRSFAYDALGRLRTSTTPEGQTTQVLAYDPAGRPIETVDARGRVLLTYYDDAGRVLEVWEDRNGAAYLLAKNTYDVGCDFQTTPSCGNLTLTESFDEWTYDADGVGPAEPIPIAKTAYEYLYGSGRLGNQKTTFAAWAWRHNEFDGDKELRIDYAYDVDWGELQLLSYPVVGSNNRSTDQVAEIKYEFSNGWLDLVHDTSRGQTHVTVSQYNAAGGPRQWTSGSNGAVTDLMPDTRFRPSRIQVTATDGGWDSGVYSYDAAGNILAMGADAFQYDALGRLSQAIIHFDEDDDGIDEVWTEDYTYDDFGNMLSRTQTKGGQSPVLNAFTVDPDSNRIVDKDSYVLDWDPAGNLTRDPTLFAAADDGLLQFDGRGRLRGIARQLMGDPGVGRPPVGPGTWAEEFAYDASGLRVLRTDVASGLTTFYIRDITGRVLSEFVRPAGDDFVPVWQRDFIYALGQTIGVVEADSPSPPGGLEPIVTGEDPDFTVALSWKPSPPGQDVSFYRVFRFDFVLGAYVPQGDTLDETVTTWQQPVPTGLYYYRVRGVRDDGGGVEVEGPGSRIVRVDPGGSDPPAITNLSAETLEGAVRLQWDRMGEDMYLGILTDFYDYRVERQPAGATNAWVELTDLPLRVPYFVDPAPPSGDQEYRVTAIDTSGQGGGSDTTITTPATDPFRPSPPGGVFASAGPDALEASIAWDPSTEDDVTEYTIYRYDGTSWNQQSIFYWDENTEAWVSGTTVPHPFQRAKLTGLTEGVSVTLAVSASDAVGESVYLSEPLTVFPAMSTLSAPDLFAVNTRTGPITSTVTTNVTSSRFYRRVEGEKGLYALRNGTPNTSIAEADLDPCRAYYYLATRADTTTIDGVKVPTGQESADSLTVPVDRWLWPSKPHWAFAQSGGDPINFTWDGMEQCETGNYGFTLKRIFLMRQNALQEVLEVAVGSDTSAMVSDDPLFPGATHRYWLEVEYEYTDEATVPNTIATSRSKGGEWVCASENDGVLNDINCNWPPPLPPPLGGNGGGGIPPGDDRPLKPRMYKLSDPTVKFDGPEAMTDEDWVVASASGGSAAVAAVAHHSVRPSPTVSPRDNSPFDGDSRPATPRTLRTNGAVHKSAPRTDPRRAAVPQAVAELDMRLVSRRDQPRLAADGLWEAPIVVIGAGGSPGSPAQRGMKTTYLHADHLGTRRLVTDGNGTTVAMSGSLPFGETIASSPSTEYAGHRRQGSEALVYMLSRAYSAELARFTSPDPFVPNALNGAPQTWNRYSYVWNRPIVLVDPDGRYPSWRTVEDHRKVTLQWRVPPGAGGAGYIWKAQLKAGDWAATGATAASLNWVIKAEINGAQGPVGRDPRPGNEGGHFTESEYMGKTLYIYEDAAGNVWAWTLRKGKDGNVYELRFFKEAGKQKPAPIDGDSRIPEAPQCGLCELESRPPPAPRFGGEVGCGDWRGCPQSG